MRRLSINNRTRKNLVLALLAGAALLCSGCSSFNRNWKASLAQPAPDDGLSGPWDGQWVSSKNGHRGRLRCIMEAKGDGRFDARFHAVFWKIFRASYKVPFHAVENDGAWKFEGESDLGKLAGGIYTYEGTADGTNFLATYKSKYDHGRFEMRRPRREP